MTTVIDEKQQREAQAELRSNTDVAKRNVAAHVERHRIYLLAIFAMLLAGFEGWRNLELAKLAQVNREIVWEKMMPDGTWYEQKFTPGGQQQFYKNTVDHLLERFVITRYGLQPETIKADYTEAGNFMSEAMYASFTGTAKGQFNAAQRVKDVQANAKSFDRIDIKYSFADYYDKVPGQFDGKAGEVIRTNVYFTRTRRTFAGQPLGQPERMIARLQWRLVSPDDMRGADESYRRANPIGLEILDDPDVIPEPTTQGGNAAKDKNA